MSISANGSQSKSAKEFAEYWKDRGYEKGETQTFWLTLLRDVLGVANPEKTILFEEQIKLENIGFIDALIPSTHVLIEQKSKHKDAREKIKQSDGSFLTPFQQASRYASKLPYSQRPRWIVVCNFAEFLVYDMERPDDEPESILLKDLGKEYYRLNFLIDVADNHIERETEISVRAGEIVGRIYDKLLEQYRDPTDPRSLQSLNLLCVRLVFCLYAEDAELFGKHMLFHDYLQALPGPEYARQALIELFRVLDQKAEERDPYLSEKLAAFPYVNGGLFSDESIEIPNLTQEILDLIVNDASAEFNWKEISPTIFGAVFESALNPETRRSGGMHYTSIENIHKAIDPLFLDDLREEFDEIKKIKTLKTRNARLTEFQEKLGSLAFFDPACGSGNFLTETYISLRRIENEILRLLYPEGSIFSVDDPEGVLKVSIANFYGIEINDYAVAVANAALWIAESQAMEETEGILQCDMKFLPLKSYSNIKQGNALRIDWNDVAPKDKLNYIVGNPPFVGYSLQTKEQKEDVLSIYVDEKGKTYKTAGKIDYVACWYFKAAQYIQGANIRVAFVSTNSITQGDQVAFVWKPIYERFDVHIDFAHRTFRWDSEASIKAHVHCVIVGFSSLPSDKPKRLYDGDSLSVAQNIGPYLIDAPIAFIESRSKPICDVVEITSGNRPTDNGSFFLTPEEKAEILKSEPNLASYIRRTYGAEEFINNKERYCFWLVDAPSGVLRSSKVLRERLEKIREARLSSSKEKTREDADTPWLFQEIRQPTGDYIIVPRHSSENRLFIPLGFLDSETIPTDAVQIIPNATLYHFGVLTSSVHMAWTRAVCGRLEMRYRYSNKIVYNNFPWPNPTEEERLRVESTARMILDARALEFSRAESLGRRTSLADLYDDLVMPAELRKAHRENDATVFASYRFPEHVKTESEIVAELMKRYRALTER